MMQVDVFILGLLICSTFTGLLTEAVKKILDEHKVNYYANTLAGICAVIVAVLIGAGYLVISAVPITASVVVMWIALVILSWMCAMVGYDKVIQTIEQLMKWGDS